MSRSFGAVEDKLSESEFFLDKLLASNNALFEANCYFSAFVSATRSVTFAMQASLKGVPGFKEWYQHAQDSLKSDPLAPFFVEIRNEIVHIGATPLNCTSIDHLQDYLATKLESENGEHILVMPDKFRRDQSSVIDGSEACQKYFVSLVSIVFDCYSEFIHVLDG